MNDEDDKQFMVVMNHEEQYSIWPAQRDMALGWRAMGKIGNKSECLSYIKETWVDMRPLSLRLRMESDTAANVAVRVVA